MPFRFEHLCAAALLFAHGALIPSNIYAVEVIVDGLDDLDRDNDGISDDGNETVVGSPAGISWFAINGLTGSGTKQKPFLTVVDDTGGIDSGPALNVESVGSNGEFMGSFDQAYELGDVIGSRIAVSFDIRIIDLFLPSSAEFRFGIYGDTDGQFGTASTNTDGSPTTWGFSDGNFDAESPGAVGDLGIYARIQVGESLALDGSQTRIVDEANVNNILGGSGDNDLIKQAGDDLFGVISDGSVYSLELAVERAAAIETGESVLVTLSMTDDQGTTTTLSRIDNDAESSTPIVSGDIFRYFVGNMTADVDYRIDNFVLDVEEVVALAGDFNGDGMVDVADYTVWRDNLGAGDESSLNGAGDGLNGVDIEDYNLWKTNFGLPAATLSSVPEPGALSLLLAGAMLALGRRSKAS